MTRRILVGFLIVLGLAVPASSQVELSEEARRANFDRLVQVKRKWDPDELFKFRQSIPVRIS